MLMQVVKWKAHFVVFGLVLSELLLIIWKFHNALQTQRRAVYSMLHLAFLFCAEAACFDAECPHSTKHLYTSVVHTFTSPFLNFYS